jgi:hypothetical protein
MIYTSFLIEKNAKYWKKRGAFNLCTVILAFSTVLDSLLPYSLVWKQCQDMPAHYLECLSNVMYLSAYEF